MVEESRNQPVPGHPRSSHERAEAGRADLRSPLAGGRVVLNELWRELASESVSAASLAASTCEVVLAESGGNSIAVYERHYESLNDTQMAVIQSAWDDTRG